MSTFNIINPHNETIIDTIQYEPLSTIEPIAINLHNQFNTWKTTSLSQRAQHLINIAEFLADQQDHLAKLITTDMGKPITESIQEVRKSIECCNYYANQITSIEQKLHTPSIIREPLGVILGIMPWNYPLWQMIRFMIPTLMAGNTCLIKPADNTYRIAATIQSFFKQNNLPIMDICIPTNSNCEKLITHKIIAGVSLTGSVTAGKTVGQIATAHLKPCVLELGGSDPYIIFDDANQNEAIEKGLLM